MVEENGGIEEQEESGHTGHGSQQIRNMSFQSTRRPGQRPQPGTYAGSRPDRNTRV